jgi:hypothetical protein
MIILAEETISYLKDESPILLNPSSTELGTLWREMFSYGAIRFSAIAKTKHLYAWNGDESTHAQVAEMMPELRAYHDVGNQRINPPSIFTGAGPFANGKIRLVDSDVFTSLQYDQKRIEAALKFNWSWTDRYIEGSIAEFLKKQLERRGKKS